MYSLVLMIHVSVCFLLVVIVLLQAGRSGGFQGIFGSSGEVIFSTPSGSSFLRKLTIGLAIGFGATSLILTIMTKSRVYESVTTQFPVQVQQQQQTPQQEQQTQQSTPPQNQPTTQNTQQK